jgi:xylose dehydrogenase (NAD/NADP)
MNQKLNLGLLGASKIADRILNEINQSGFNVVGVAARNAKRAQEFSEKNKLARAFESYDALLADKSINAVYISVVNSAHAELIKKSLLAGKHVLCEKTLTLNSSDAAEVFNMAKERDLVLLEGLMYRFHPQIIRARQIIDSGEIGVIKSIQCDFSFLLYSDNLARATRAAGGGALNDLGCYIVDFASVVTGFSQISSVQSVMNKNSEIDLSFSAIINFASGVVATLSASIETPGLNIWEVRGTKGSVAMIRNSPQGVDDVPLIITNDESESLTEMVPIKNNQFREQFKNFYEAVCGVAKVHIPPEQSLFVNKLMAEIRAKAFRN